MELLKDLSRIMQEAQGKMTSSEFMRAASFLSQSKDQAREQIQNITTKEIQGAIAKLKSGESLDEKDISYMKLWIVGDAESYVAMENNLQGWLVEFQRLQGIVNEYENKELSFDDTFTLQGILEDAVRVSADIGNFLDKKERMKKFEEATQDQESLDRAILARILEQKIASPIY